MVAAADEAVGKITPRNDIAAEDFKDIWLVADYSDKNGAKKGGYLAIHMLNGLSTGGFQLKTGDKSKRPSSRSSSPAIIPSRRRIRRLLRFT